MAAKKREPRTLVHMVCPRCRVPGSDGTTPRYFGTTVPASRADVAVCDNCETALTPVGETKEG